MRDEDFLDKHITDQIQSLLDDGHINASFILMAQSIEVLGAYLDNKPIKAENQSKKRFREAIYRLFPVAYARQNKGDKLYRQFRSSLAHALLPSKHINLVNNKPDLHLKDIDNKLTINAESLFSDIKNACEIIKRRLRPEDIRRKRIL